MNLHTFTRLLASLLATGTLATQAAESPSLENKQRRLEYGTRAPSLAERKDRSTRGLEAVEAPGWKWKNKFWAGPGYTMNADSVPDGTEAWFGAGELALGGTWKDVRRPIDLTFGYTGDVTFYEGPADSNDEMDHILALALKYTPQKKQESEPDREWNLSFRNTHVVIENDSVLNVAAGSLDFNSTLPWINRNLTGGVTSAHQWRAPKGTPSNPRRNNRASRLIETAYLSADLTEGKKDTGLPVIEVSYAYLWHLARGAERDFNGWQIATEAAWALNDAGRSLTLGGFYGREDAGNAANGPTFSGRRHDRIVNGSCSFVEPMSGGAALKLGAEYGRTKSNVPDSTYHGWSYFARYARAL